MATKTKNRYLLTPDVIFLIAIHPGSILKNEIKARELKLEEVADSLEVSSVFLIQLLEGKESINPNLAVKLEKLLDISAETWINFQIGYEIDIAKIKYRDYIKELKGEDVTRCPLLVCSSCS